MEFDMTKVVEKITMQVEENQEEFIFETIYPYCENILQMKINKEELKQILLNSKRKQQPCEDCISREDVLKVVNSLTEICDSDIVEKITTLNNIDWIKMKINEIPSVTPSRPKGKWIHWTDDYKDYVTCSCCEYGEEGEVLLSDKTPFCPICGADMRESEGEG